MARPNPRVAIVRLHDEISELAQEVARIEGADVAAADAPAEENTPYNRRKALRRALISEELTRTRARLDALQARADELERPAPVRTGYRLDEGLWIHHDASWLRRARPSSLLVSGRRKNRAVEVARSVAGSRETLAPHSVSFPGYVLRFAGLVGLVLLVGTSASGLTLRDTSAGIGGHVGAQLTDAVAIPPHPQAISGAEEPRVGVTLAAVLPEPRASGAEHIMPEPKTRSAVISAPGFNLRENPSIKGRVLETLPPNSAVTVVGGIAEGDGFQWVQVQATDGKSGWVVEEGLGGIPAGS